VAVKWLPVVGWEGLYEVSDHGSVRSLDRLITHRGRAGSLVQRPHRGRVLELVHHPAGYLATTIGGQSRLVHRLVARAFLGPPVEKGMEVCHWDGNPTNNSLSNLRWDTRSGNKLDEVRHGTHASAKKSHCPWGHWYEGGSVAIEVQSDGGFARRCVSCRYGRHRSARNPQLDRRAEADKYYVALSLEEE
jgi:hypothetical protein